MNGFYVCGRCGMDDIRLRLCHSIEEAIEFERTLKPTDIIVEARRVLGLGVSHLLGVSVVEFRDGAPIRSRYLRMYEELDEDFMLDENSSRE